MDLEKAVPRLSRKTIVALLVGGLALVLVLTGVLAGLHPLPPRSLVLACGPEGSSYASFGKRYQKLLAEQGIKLHLLTTAGGVENLALLNKKGSNVQLGFVEGGLTATANDESDDNGLESLGTITYEPIWCFTQGMSADAGLPALRGKRVVIGPEGGSTREVVKALLKRNSMDLNSFQALTYAPEAAQDALLAKKADAVILVSSYASPVVRKLAKQDGIRLASFRRADAYVAMFPTLTKRIMPAGAADLLKDRPAEDVELLATKTSLIVRGDLHPALKYMLLETLPKVHGRSGIFQRAGEFPAAETQDYTLAPEATHYYKSGRPFLQRFLPFWIAALVEELVVLLIPIIGLSYPLIKGLTWLYGWGMQRKIFTAYGELHWIELQVDKLGSGPVPPELEVRMKRLEDRVGRIRLATKYLPMHYSLKDNLASVRERINARGK